MLKKTNSTSFLLLNSNSKINSNKNSFKSNIHNGKNNVKFHQFNSKTFHNVSKKKLSSSYSFPSLNFNSQDISFKKNNINNNNTNNKNYNIKSIRLYSDGISSSFSSSSIDNQLSTEQQQNVNREEKEEELNQSPIIETKQKDGESNTKSSLKTSSNVFNQESDVELAAEETSLEIKDPAAIFERVLSKLEQKYGMHNLRFPKEIFFLCGAPGSGKGTISPFIVRERGLTGTLVVSDILKGPTAAHYKERGIMIPDREVVSIVFEELLKNSYRAGVIIDGFPRTRVQAHCIMHLYDKMIKLRKHYTNTPLEPFFPRPRFRSIVLFVDEKTSIERQLYRAKEAAVHNKKVKAAKLGGMKEIRTTDTTEESARKRYEYFKKYTYESLLELKDKFHFHFIDASYPVSEVQKFIAKELRYQSTLELGQDTYDTISEIPLAEDVTRYARQNLVQRLDHYQKHNTELFRKVMKLVQSEFIHIIRRQALTGVAIVRTENSILNDPLSLDMVLDVLAERGYRVILDYERREVPISVDPHTNLIHCSTKKTFHFEVHFKQPQIRD